MGCSARFTYSLADYDSPKCNGQWQEHSLGKFQSHRESREKRGQKVPQHGLLLSPCHPIHNDSQGEGVELQIIYGCQLHVCVVGKLHHGRSFSGQLDLQVEAYLSSNEGQCRIPANSLPSRTRN